MSIFILLNIHHSTFLTVPRSLDFSGKMLLSYPITLQPIHAGENKRNAKKQITSMGPGPLDEIPASIIRPPSLPRIEKRIHVTPDIMETKRR